jgi:hypothetical protein
MSDDLNKYTAPYYDATTATSEYVDTAKEKKCCNSTEKFTNHSAVESGQPDMSHWRGKQQAYYRQRFGHYVYPFKPYHYPADVHDYVYTHLWPYTFPGPYNYVQPAKYTYGPTIEQFTAESENNGVSPCQSMHQLYMLALFVIVLMFLMKK